MRLSGAVPVLRERPAVGLEAVLRGQIAGTAAPATPAPDMHRVDVLDVLESLRLEVQRLSREVAELRDHMQTRPDNRPDNPLAGHPDARTPAGHPDDRMAEELASDHADAPAPTAPAATAPDADQLRDLEVGTSLRVASTTLPSRLKNDLRWAADRYEALEAVLRGTQAVTLHRTNGKVSWRTDNGDTMRRETVARLLKAEILQMMDA